MFRLFMDTRAMDIRDIRFLSALICNFDLREFTLLPADRIAKLFRKRDAIATTNQIRTRIRSLRKRGFLEAGPEVLNGQLTYRLRPQFWATPETVAEHARQCLEAAERSALLPATYNPQAEPQAIYRHLIALRNRKRGRRAVANRG